MKKNFLFAISILGLLGPFGCGKMQMPTTPSAQVSNPVIQTKVAAPRYTSSWSTAGAETLVNPQGIAVDSNGYIYVTDLFLGVVLKFDTNGNLLSQWGKRGDYTFDEPTGIAVRNGYVYVADSSNYRVLEFDTNGNFVAELKPKDGDGNDLFAYPTGVSLDNQGNLYVADNSDAVYRFDGDLRLTGQWDSTTATALNLDYPMASTEDGFGNVYVANYYSDSIVKFASSTGSSIHWGNHGAQNGQLDGPSDVKLDSNGNVYVADSLNNRIQIFSTTGVYMGQFGDSSDPNQTLNTPYSMAFDSNGNLYVVDNGNTRIVKYSTK